MSAGRHRSGPEGRREGGGTMRFSCLEIGGGAISERSRAATVGHSSEGWVWIFTFKFLFLGKFLVI